MTRLLTPDEITSLRELVPLARLKRRQHSETDKHTVASQQFTELLKSLHEEGATVTELAKATGLKYHSIRARILK